VKTTVANGTATIVRGGCTTSDDGIRPSASPPPITAACNRSVRFLNGGKCRVLDDNFTVFLLKKQNLITFFKFESAANFDRYGDLPVGR
jgi:hypothetical protein